jgi:PhnB protein
MRGGRKHIRHGLGAARPYVHGHLSLSDFVRRAFEAHELERVATGTGFHVEMQIDDSVVVLEIGDPPHESATRSAIYVYVDDVDEAYRRALNAGAMSIDEPSDKPYQERSAGVRDTFGNTWWISTLLADPDDREGG